MGDAIVKLEGLTKKYDGKAVVDHVSLEIRQGEIFGLLGPNGAGKSTTMNMICSLVKPTAGKIRLFGKNAIPQRMRVSQMTKTQFYLAKFVPCFLVTFIEMGLAWAISALLFNVHWSQHQCDLFSESCDD